MKEYVREGEGECEIERKRERVYISRESKRIQEEGGRERKGENEGQTKKLLL